MDGPARPASARPHRQGWPSPTRIGLRLACSKALERFLALMGRHLARASEANAALLGSLAALAGRGGRGPKMRPTFFGRARGRKFPEKANTSKLASTKRRMALVNADREIVRKIMTEPGPRWEPQFPAEGRKCGQLFSGRARGRRAVGYFLRSTFDLPTESPKIIAR